MRIALIGFGGIGRLVVSTLRADRRLAWVAVAARERQRRDVAAALGGVPVVTGAEALIAARPDVVIECASHDAFRAYAEPVLRAGIDVIALSVGVLADRGYRARVLEAAEAGGAALELPAGAIGGLDAVAAARHAGLTEVVYATRKAPALWRGTAAESMIDLAEVREARLFFDANAQEAALRFPSKANVTATLALAGVGFEATRVQFWADPGAARSTHRITAVGACGRLEVELANAVAADGRSSLLTAMSVVRTIRNRIRALRL